jgi:hypothetical protein
MRRILLAAMLLAAPAQAAEPASALPFGELPPQVLAKGSCAMFLWERAGSSRVAMVVAGEAPVLRVLRDGKLTSLAAVPGSASGTPVMGFAPSQRFADAQTAVSIDVTIIPNPDGIGGVVRDGALTLTRPDGEAVVAPVAGLLGCG